LRSAEPKNDWDRVLSLQLAFYMPDLVSAEKRDAALKLLTSKQHADGGWSTRDFSALNDWHFEVSETSKNSSPASPMPRNPKAMPT
jgi:squalene-hopene/tetraprenyl-beta-curcumene cyclase